MSTSVSHAGGSGAGRKARTPQQQVASHYKSLRDQLEGNFFDNALKTCDRILRLTPGDQLAFQTKVQLLVQLDRYPDALALLAAQQDAQASVEQAYCMYKSGREVQALGGLRELDAEVRESRTAMLVEAQVLYRLGEYELCRDLFEELIATVDPESPELDDLQANLQAANAHLGFLTTVPSQLASSTVAPIESLESTPVISLVQAHPLYKSVAQPLASSSTLAAVAVPKVPKRLPKKYDPNVKPDPDRWLPRRERQGYGEEIARKREQARGRNKGKAREQLLTQGAADSAPSTSKSGGGGNKKKKGKK